VGGVEVWEEEWGEKGGDGVGPERRESQGQLRGGCKREG
jgi:hypothetical protein